MSAAHTAQGAPSCGGHIAQTANPALWPRSLALPNAAEFAILIGMVDKSPALEALTPQERIVLMGRLWDSLDSVTAAPLSSALAVELERRETEADADPDAGIPWDALRDELQTRLR